uniref:Putative aquaporin major intrinsic protein family n=1 Tax=Tabanus bromius TaxID=304241 RepID=A0A0K8TQ22_TABBR
MQTDTFNKISIFLAEVVGTSLLVYLGCMGCLTTFGTESNFLSSNLSFGFVVMIIIQIFGCVSGAHLNPSVTVAAVVYKLVTLPMGVVYVVAQLLGAFIGFGMLKAVVPFDSFMSSNGTGAGLCTTVPHADLHPFQAIAIEFSITMVLILVCCGVWDPRNAQNTDSVAIKFGLTVAAIGCIAGPLTGASMNPARSFGPAFWNGHFEYHWIYWVAPLSAGLFTSLAYRAVFWRKEETERTFIPDFSLRMK